MRSISIILLILFWSLLAAAQREDIVAELAEKDRLKNLVLTATNDTQRVSALRQLSWLYVYSSPDSALKFSTQALNLTERIGTKEEHINLLTVLSQALSYKGQREGGYCVYNSTANCLNWDLWDNKIYVKMLLIPLIS